MTHYGRPRNGTSGTESPPAQTVQKAAGRVLALGGAMIAGFFLLMTVPGEKEVSGTAGIPEGAVAVMSTAVAERESLAVPEETREEAAGAEPFGYMNGEWNLWEYIGDLMWSLLS